MVIFYMLEKISIFRQKKKQRKMDEKMMKTILSVLLVVLMLVGMINSVTYSVESYVAGKLNDSNVKLANVVASIIKYGDAAYNLNH